MPRPQHAIVAAIPPALPAVVIERPRLERMLDGGVARRLTLVLADAGFGKSTLLASWASRHRTAWHTVGAADRDAGRLAGGLLDALALWVPGLGIELSGLLTMPRGPDTLDEQHHRARALAAALAQDLQRRLARELALVLDDVQEIDRGGPAATLLDGLCRQAPAGLRIVLASRTEPPFPIDRLRAQAQVATIEGGMLAFTPDETVAAVEAELGAGPEALPGPQLAEAARAIHEATGGWPAAVRLAIEQLRHRPPAAPGAAALGLLRPAGPLFDYLAGEVVAHEPASTRRLVRAMAVFDRFTAGMCQAIGLRGAAATLEELARRGLFVQPVGDGPWYRLHPLVREFVLARQPLTRDAVSRLRRAAAIWLRRAGEEAEALSVLQAAGDEPAMADLLEDVGTVLVERGEAAAVAKAAAEVGGSWRTPAIDAVEGAARRVTGDWDGALACLGRAAGRHGPAPAAIAWQIGLIHHLRGDLDQAIAAYERGADDITHPADLGLLRAWWAGACWLRGDAERCRGLAEAALDAANASGNDRALAAAHTVLAMVAALDGDRRANDAHYLRALDHAERAGDALQVIRIRANRGSRFIEEGHYLEAIDELDVSIELADVTGFAAFRALALSNRGEALRRLGRLDETRTDLEAARALYQRLESRLVSYPLGHLGDVYRERGDTVLARASYEEAISVAEAAGDLQGLVPALAGLARVLAPGDPERAAGLADRAVALGPTLGHVGALLARGWIALARGDAPAAAADARAASALARTRRDRAGLAEAIELEVAAGKGHEARGRLGEALDIWRDLGSPVGQARVQLRLAAMADGSAAARLRLEAEALLAVAGARAGPAAAFPAGELERTDEPATTMDGTIAVRALGAFEVVRSGRTIGPGEWPSRKARELLKILVARRGSHVPRDVLVELLWPDEDPARAARRLSVALSTLRAVLDPDRSRAPDWFVAADRASLWLIRDHVAIDLEAFLNRADAALAVARAGGRAGAATGLRTAQEAYGGDFLEEDPYEDWATGPREEARATYLDVCHALARLASDQGDHAAAASHLRRILERDPYDERAHLGLVGTLAALGRHGDARRAYQSYIGRMGELEMEPAPFPASGTGDRPPGEGAGASAAGLNNS